MKKYTVLMVTAILLWSCTKDCQEPNFQYIFIELIQGISQEVLNGDCTIVPPPQITPRCGGYTYDPTSKIIKDYCDGVEINDSLKLIVGRGEYTMLLGVYKLPYVYGDFKIENITTEGEIYYSYKDTLKSLKLNERFENQYSEINTIMGYDQDGEPVQDSCKIETEYFIKFINHDLLGKSNYTHVGWE